MKAFAYLRVSGLSQTHGDGFPRQRAAIESYAAKNGIDIAEWFEEEGVSGTKDLDHRPALGLLFVALEENGIKTVLVEKLDRLARDLMIQESIVSDMQRRGFTLISTMEPDLCSSDPSRVLIRQIFGALSQYERAMIVLKLRAAKERKKATGAKAEGRKAFGENADEVPILVKMQAQRDSGQTFQQIADALNRDGIPSRMGGPWRVGTVARILSRC